MQAVDAFGETIGQAESREASGSAAPGLLVDGECGEGPHGMSNNSIISLTAYEKTKRMMQPECVGCKWVGNKKICSHCPYGGK